MTYLRSSNYKANLTIREILARLEGKVQIQKPVVYANSDIQAAKNVLTRLLATPSRNEVVSIQLVPTQIEES